MVGSSLFRLTIVGLAGMLGLACGAGAPLASQQATQETAKPLNFANADRLQEHWQKHVMTQHEFGGTISKDEYLKKARAFFANTANDNHYLTQMNHDFVKYRVSTNEFGVLSGENVIRTYFRPRGNGLEYFERQKKR